MLNSSFSPALFSATLVAIAMALPAAASAERLVSATIGLNYIGQGHCVVVNPRDTGMVDARITIIDAPTANQVANSGIITIFPGTSVTLPFQAPAANLRDYFCEVTDVTPEAELRMVFKRVSFGGDVSEASDGLPTALIEAGTVGNTSEPGAPGPKTIFVTSTTQNGDIGGLDAADGICQGLADAPSSMVPEGEYLALLSDDTTSAASRLTASGGPYLNPAGLPIADGLRDLFRPRLLLPPIANHGAPVLLDESGSIPVSSTVWTGTMGDGAPFLGVTCDSWASDSNADVGAVADASEISRDWISTTSEGCGNVNAFYCVQR